ncbi:30461_t:CDS:1, partial [Gigaspora margarita]
STFLFFEFFREATSGWDEITALFAMIDFHAHKLASLLIPEIMIEYNLFFQYISQPQAR